MLDKKTGRSTIESLYARAGGNVVSSAVMVESAMGVGKKAAKRARRIKSRSRARIQF